MPIKQTDDHGKKITRRALAPVEKYLRENPGSMAAMRVFLTRRLKKSISRQQISRWFMQDTAARPEPVYSSGALMLEWYAAEKKNQRAFMGGEISVRMRCNPKPL